MKTVSDLLKELQELKTKKEAKKYLMEYLKENPYSWSNICYVTSYLESEERDRILTLFRG